ncbi:MAG TPA: hypothetical protein VHE55_06115 [Fimbriimonadaceae bacterium]|nr:hypothetical protein [Fimbriimonadaceae bacterium]
MFRQSENQSGSISGQREYLEQLAFYPALTLLVFTRSRLGYRLVNPRWLVGTALAMVGFGTIVSGSSGGSELDLPLLEILALGVVAAGLKQRWEGWQDFKKGIGRYSYSSGVPKIEKLRLPRFIRSLGRTKRILEPLLAYVVGLIIWQFVSTGLGAWIAFSAFCLAIFETGRYLRGVERSFDVVDGLCESDAQGRVVDYFKRGDEPLAEASVGTLQKTSRRSTAIPVGLDADLQNAMARRKAAGKLRDAGSEDPASP